MANQDTFKTIYRGRQGALHHMAYMRMSKVILTRHILEQAGINLADKLIFDYGFGAGTFFRYCPASSQIFGVEIDPLNVAEVQRMLLRRGYTKVDLQAIDPDHWDQHPLLQQPYDVVLCSHVLEHLPEPVAFLRRIRECLRPDGVLVGLLPINEIRNNPHHVQKVEKKTVLAWLEESRLRMRCYVESDPWVYWSQPLFTAEAGLAWRIAQAISLSLGVPATWLGYRRWERLSPWFGRLTFSKPTQVAFVACRGG